LDRIRYAFNITRQSFISLGVTVADTPWARLRGLLGRMRIRSDEGLWLVPSRGIHTFGLMFPIDVIYLDSNLRVVHLVESLGPRRFGPLRLRCRSVLELPGRSIYGSGTQVGDQLMICAPKTMEAYWTSPAPQDEEVGTELRRSTSKSEYSMRWPWRQKRPKERRRSPRIPVECLEAVYWDGSANSSHAVAEVSFDGAMIETDVGWIEGTLILLSFRRIHSDGQAQDPAATSQLWCRVVRRAPKGFCVEFLFSSRSARRAFSRYLDTNEVRLRGDFARS